MSEYKKRIAPMKKLKLMRISRDLTIVQLAEKTGINRNTINQYELGIHKPRIDNLQAIADALECTINDLI